MADGIPCLLCGGWISKVDNDLTVHYEGCPMIEILVEKEVVINKDDE